CRWLWPRCRLRSTRFGIAWAGRGLSAAPRPPVRGAWSPTVMWTKPTSIAYWRGSRADRSAAWRPPAVLRIFLLPPVILRAAVDEEHGIAFAGGCVGNPQVGPLQMMEF